MKTLDEIWIIANLECIHRQWTEDNYPYATLREALDDIDQILEFYMSQGEA